MTKATQLFPAHDKITGSANTLFCPEQKPRVGTMPRPRGHCEDTQYYYFFPLLQRVATMNTKPYQTMSAQYMLVTMCTKTQTVYKKPQACLISQLNILPKIFISKKCLHNAQPKDQEMSTQTIVMLDCSWTDLQKQLYCSEHLHHTKCIVLYSGRQNVADRLSLTSS